MSQTSAIMVKSDFKNVHANCDIFGVPMVNGAVDWNRVGNTSSFCRYKTPPLQSVTLAPTALNSASIPSLRVLRCFFDITHSPVTLYTKRRHFDPHPMNASRSVDFTSVFTNRNSANFILNVPIIQMLDNISSKFVREISGRKHRGSRLSRKA